MSRLNVLDLSQYMANEELRLENQNFKNCKISGIKNKFLTIYRCRFNNVEFENSFHDVYASFKECEFEECVFRDTFQGEDLELVVQENIFIDCVFENICYRSFQVQSNIVNCKFINCNFTDIAIEGDLCFIGLELKSGTIENFSFHGNQVMQNSFSDLQISNMDLECAFIKNRLERIDLKGVKITGYCKDNILIECEPNTIEMM